MNTNGLLLYKSFEKIKKFNIHHFHHMNLGNLKPHEFFMLMIIINRYDQMKIEAKNHGTIPPLGVKISEISHIANVSMPATSQKISNLVKHDYLKRITTDSDRRLVYVNVTEKSRKLEAQISETFSDLYEEVSNILGEEQTLELIELLDKLSDAFNQIDHKKINSERKTP